MDSRWRSEICAAVMSSARSVRRFGDLNHLGPT